MKSRVIKGIGLLALIVLVGISGLVGFSANSTTPVQSLDQLIHKLPFRTNNPAIDESPSPPPQTVSVESGSVGETVIAPGQISGVKEQVVPAGVSGIITELNVRPGDHVSAGQVIAQIDKRPYEDALNLAQIKLDQAQDALDQQTANAELALQMAENGVTSAQAGYSPITAAQIRVEQAERTLAQAQTTYDQAFDPARAWELNVQPQADQLKAEREAAEQSLQFAWDDLAIAQAELQAAQNRQWATSQNVDAAEISVEEAELNLENLRSQGLDPLLQWELDKARTDLAATTITAPFNGIILERNVRNGENVVVGQPLFVIADTSRGELLATVIEEDLPLVQPGQTVEIYLDAAPDGIITGTVDRIVPQRTGGDRPTYPVYITIDNLPENILPGMTADAIIVIQRVENALRLPRALVRAGTDNRATVQVWNGREIENRDIFIGLRGDIYVEILSGLASGEQVVCQ